MGNWIRYAAWEEKQGEVNRGNLSLFVILPVWRPSYLMEESRLPDSLNRSLSLEILTIVFVLFGEIIPK
jgi:CBS domain containing-hemolysin-like protein